MSNSVYEIREALSWTLHGCHIRYDRHCLQAEVDINTEYVCEWLIGIKMVYPEPRRKVLFYDCMCHQCWRIWKMTAMRCKWWLIWHKKQVFPLSCWVETRREQAALDSKALRGRQAVQYSPNRKLSFLNRLIILWVFCTHFHLKLGAALSPNQPVMTVLHLAVWH